MIDTDYNGDGLFVRHCYFTGGGDSSKRLETARKAEIDTEAWANPVFGTDDVPEGRIRG